MTEDWKSRLENAAEGQGPSRVVPWLLCRELAACAGLPAREVERWACENGIVPSRYERNIGTLGLDGQGRLLGSTAAVVGCGGLGGLLTDLLARAGVGRLVLVDGDTFTDHNLNRQLLCDESNLGQSKATAAARRVDAVNGAVETRVVEAFLEEANALQILSGCDLAVDALDSNGARRILRNACRELGIPHGSTGPSPASGGRWGSSSPRTRPRGTDPREACPIGASSLKRETRPSLPRSWPPLKPRRPSRCWRVFPNRYGTTSSGSTWTAGSSTSSGSEGSREP
jgi:Dinucleotide-utilizing enzymes involved in molybdopterin and thiamine biosynthesis family 2